MSVKTWTAFGTGNFINDINDAIESNNERLEQVVLNMEVSGDRLGRIPSSVKVIRIDDFRPSTDKYIFGFIDHNKGPLLASLGRYRLKYSNLVHSFSYIANTVEMGEGNYIGAGVVLLPNVRLGNFNYVNRMSSIGHDTVVADFNHLAAGSILAGRCSIGSRNFLGVRSTLIDGITIGDDITIGAGGVVIRDINEKGTYVGVPAKKIR